MNYSILASQNEPVLFSCSAWAHRDCIKDEDCEILGDDLKCVYSGCPNKGVCGCERGYVARFAGSQRNYRCVPRE